MTEDEKLYFRDQLREARAVALKDAEAFEPVVHVLERMGRFLKGVTSEVPALAVLKKDINPLALCSPLAECVPDEWPELHLNFTTLYELVKDGRNSAVHEGALARHLTGHAVELSIILEHALMDGLKKVKHFMVKNPVCAEMWQPVSFIRQMMLSNSFSYLPVLDEKGRKAAWRIVSDLELARYLQSATSKTDLRKHLTRPLRDAVDAKDVRLLKAPTCNPDEEVSKALKGWKGVPVLVTSEHSGAVLGILTPFDLL